MATYIATSCPITTDNAGLSAVWGGSLSYETTHLSKAYINLSSLLPYTINPESVTHVRVDFRYGNYYCQRSHTVCSAATLGLGASRTSDVVKLGYSTSTTMSLVLACIFQM